MSDGHLNKCKECTKKEEKDRLNKKMSDKEWVEKERKRSRQKYHRLGYRDIHKPTKEDKKKAISKYKEKYPEKQKAKSALSKKIKAKTGFNLHHWSYNQEHFLDVIELSVKDHQKSHRFMIYDQERMMYRRYDNNELLDTKEKHEAFIKYCIENKED